MHGGAGRADLRARSAAAHAEVPESALRGLAELRHELEQFVRANVERALASGRSFGDVARALSISRQAARRYRDLAPERAPQRQAGLVAVARGDERLGSDELQLAALAALAALADRDGGALRTLVALGVTPASVRTRLDCWTAPS